MKGYKIKFLLHYIKYWGLQKLKVNKIWKSLVPWARTLWARADYLLIIFIFCLYKKSSYTILKIALLLHHLIVYWSLLISQMVLRRLKSSSQQFLAWPAVQCEGPRIKFCLDTEIQFILWLVSHWLPTHIFWESIILLSTFMLRTLRFRERKCFA